MYAPLKEIDRLFNVTANKIVSISGYLRKVKYCITIYINTISMIMFSITLTVYLCKYAVFIKFTDEPISAQRWKCQSNTGD